MSRELVYNDELTAPNWALNSAVECHLHTVEVIGSNPIAPTIHQLVWLVQVQVKVVTEAGQRDLVVARNVEAELAQR